MVLLLLVLCALALFVIRSQLFKAQRQSLEDKTVWVTGASSGIGLAIATSLAQIRGVKLVLSSRNRAKLEEARSAILTSCKISPQRVVVAPLNLSELSTKSAEEVLNTATELVGSEIDVLCCAAGMSMRGAVKDTSLEVDRTLMATNYFGNVALVKSVLPRMLHKRSGTVVFVSSLQGKFGIAKRSAYAASKFALHGFADSLRVEVEDQGINVCCVCPGYVNTNLSLNALNGDGSAYGKMDENTSKGFEPSKVAERVIKAIRTGEREVIIAKPAHAIAVVLNSLIPNVIHTILKRRLRGEEMKQGKKQN